MTVVLDSAHARKARGAFFTPQAICDYVSAWAIRSGRDEVLEPSCGEAAFLTAAAKRFDGLGAVHAVLHGHELHDPSAERARQLLSGTGHSIDVQVGDFFARVPEPRYDVVIGNPPYIRYQDFAGPARAAGREAALRAGVNLTALASSWAAFTVHSSLFLKPGGRLGLVLPAELLSVNYAADVRRFLMQRFGRVRLVCFTERVFPGVLEEVVLLLAEGEGPTDSCELIQVEDASALTRSDTAPISTWRPSTSQGKWTEGLIPASARSVLESLQPSQGFVPLQRWGETTLGAVTGNNRYFVMSDERAHKLGIPGDELLKFSPPGSRHLRGLSLTPQRWESLADSGSAVWLFRPGLEPSSAAQRYIEEGEDTGVHEAYKCRVRRPWWRVPLVARPDLFLTYMNADTPRLTTNRAGVHHLNSVHGVYLRQGLTRLGRDLLPLAMLNTVTLLGAETVGRSYGGGMLKLEPKEADVLPVPSPALVEQAREGLAATRAEVRTALDSGRLNDAVSLVDEVLLHTSLRMPRSSMHSLESAHRILSGRRTARGRKTRDE